MTGRTDNPHSRGGILVIIVPALFAMLIAGPGAQYAVTNSEAPGWEYISGGFKAVNDMWVIADDDIWLATFGGLAHYNGSLWRVVSDDPLEVGVVAVEDNGVVWYSSGTQLFTYDGAVSSSYGYLPGTIADIEMTNGTEGRLIVTQGQGTSLWKYDGQRWGDTGVRLVGEYRHIDLDEDDNVWLAGKPGAARVDRSSVVTTWNISNVADIAMLSSRRGWLVGGTCRRSDGESIQQIWSFRDDQWSLVRRVNAPGLLTVTAASETNVVAAGYDWAVVVGGDDEWSTIHEANFVTCDNSYYGAGLDVETGTTFLPARGSWGATIDVVKDGMLGALEMNEQISRIVTHGEDVWALGTNSIYRVLGPIMVRVKGPFDQAAWSDIGFDDVGQVWVGGKNHGQHTLYYKDATGWVEDESLVGIDIVRFRSSGDDRLWLLGCAIGQDADGNRRTILARRTPSTWDVSYSRSRPECAVDMDIDEVGAIWVLFDGEVWEVETDGDTHVHPGRILASTLPLCIGAAGGKAWVGAQGALLQWDGAEWSRVSFGDDAIVSGAVLNWLAGIWAASSNDVWVVGDDGGVLHFDGAEWELARADMSDSGWVAWYGLQMTSVAAMMVSPSDNTVWVGGWQRTVMKLTYPRPTVPTLIPSATADATTEPTSTPRTFMFLPISGVP